MLSAARHPHRTTSDSPRNFLSSPTNPKNLLILFIDLEINFANVSSGSPRICHNRTRAEPLATAVELSPLLS